MKLTEAKQYITSNQAPATFESGACVECAGGNLCVYHRALGLVRDNQRSESLRGISAGIRARDIGRIMSMYELESDEAGTAEQKAGRILDGRNMIPQHMMIASI